MNYTAANNEDMESPILLEMDERRDNKNNSEAKMIAEIYSAIPVDGAGVPIARNESCNNGKKDLFRMSTNVIDIDQIIFWGFLLGAGLQICAAGIILRGKSIHTATVTAAAATTDTANGSVINFYLFSLFWLLVFPPVSLFLWWPCPKCSFVAAVAGKPTRAAVVPLDCLSSALSSR